MYRMIKVGMATLALGTTSFAGGALAQSPVDTLRIIGSLPLGHHMSEALGVFEQSVEESTEIEVDTFPAGQLYNDVDSVRVLPSGSVDMGVVQLDTWMGLVPAAAVLYMPTYYENLEHFYAIRDYVTPILAERLEENADVKLLGWADYDAEAMISQKRIATLEDFQGTKLRGYGQYAASFLDAVGSSPVVMSSSEAYDAISKGVIDGTMSGPTSHLQRKFFEVADYLVADPNFIQPVLSYAILINLDTWNRLTPEQQQSVQTGADAVQVYTRDAFQEASAEALATLEAEGVETVEITDAEFQRIRDVVWPALEGQYVEQVGAETAQPILDKVEELRGE